MKFTCISCGKKIDPKKESMVSNQTGYYCYACYLILSNIIANN